MKQKELLDGFKLCILDKGIDNDIIRQYQQEIFNILVVAYEHIGGCVVYNNIKHMRQNADRYKIILKNNDIYAVATYRY